MNKILNQVAKTLTRKKLTLSVCESCTGGMLGSIITQVPGSSKYFPGGIIAYSNEVKQKTVGVKLTTLKKYGAVSTEVAREMAQGVRKRFKSDIGIGITGIAGPSGGSKKKPVGLVFISLSYDKIIFVKKYLFKGNRDHIRKKACTQALVLLNHLLT